MTGQGPANLNDMTDEQRGQLCGALNNIHSTIHDLYPELQTCKLDQTERHKLLICDLAVHLVEELVADTTLDQSRVVERTANLLFAIRLIAPGHPLREAATLLLGK